jgi:hypothetical protein
VKIALIGDAKARWNSKPSLTPFAHISPLVFSPWALRPPHEIYGPFLLLRGELAANKFIPREENKFSPAQTKLATIFAR